MNSNQNNNDAKIFLDEEMEDTITLVFEDTQVECGIIASFPVGDKDYVALLPLEEVEGLSEDEILLYGYTRKGDDFELIEIQDDDEFDMVADAFDEMLDEAAFNEMEEN
ncbi:MAG: DUF1292 domain-containing protein [Lachnospiraceae bacterium]|nr:DUF1292 domain-containing protein [Lachnospiraceae bacterium]